MTNLRLEDTYIVQETAVSGPPQSYLEDYDTTVNVYGADQFTFTIRQNDPDTPVIVTNQEKELGKLTVRKLFANTASKNNVIMSEPLVFEFDLIKPDGTIEKFSLKAGEKKVFDDLPYGEYTVQEITEGFATTYDPVDGKVTLSFADREKRCV